MKRHGGSALIMGDVRSSTMIQRRCRVGFGGYREGGEKSRGGAIIRGLRYCEAFAGVDNSFFITFSNVYEDLPGGLVTSAWDSAYSGNMGGVGVAISTIVSLETGKKSCNRGDQGAEVSRRIVHWFLGMMRGDMRASLDNIYAAE